MTALRKVDTQNTRSALAQIGPTWQPGFRIGAIRNLGRTGERRIFHIVATNEVADIRFKALLPKL